MLPPRHPISPQRARALAKTERLRQGESETDRMLREMDARPARATLEEADADVVGRSGAASSNGNHETEAQMGVCKIEGCGNDASDAPVRGPYAGRCAGHRAEKGREMSGRRNGRSSTREAPPSPPEPEAPVLEIVPAVREETPHASPLVRLLATLPADDLEDAIADLEQLRRRLDAESNLIGQALETKAAAA